MRTKALLCAAALAVGAISAVAQSNVYSLNIVGYANVSIKAGSFIYNNPLSAGASNGASEIFSTIPDGSIFSLWTGNSYNFFYYDTTIGISPNNWYKADQATPAQPPSLPPGLGFFVNPGTPFTNTFVGNVTPGPGQSGTNHIVAGSSMVGSMLPVSGFVTNSTFNLFLSDGTIINDWTGNAYHAYYYDTTIGISPNNWYLPDQQTPGPVPQFNIGQGFFINPGTPGNWVQSLPSQ